jgi:hypothetical protein
MARCRVSFVDTDQVPHAIDVDAASLYEAVAIAVSEFRNDSLNPAPGPMTEFTVLVYRNPTEHRIRLSQVTKWAEPSTKEGPAGITKRRRVRTLLGEKLLYDRQGARRQFSGQPHFTRYALFSNKLNWCSSCLRPSKERYGILLRNLLCHFYYSDGKPLAGTGRRQTSG